ncbi:VTC domain-containing protein [Micromonospora haikouensis]|uniref:VTC domain-containing protein n=1 Tax=Micromonospora haikouensis TaxID=686309 RepID=A0A1C4XQK4_9ACTN|nr:polyphosphate polymerase domain-containing protein [Micromonospora haikouensis]SCF10704.1 VTC domain-containing protein [Micromonospora haikouensis]
MNAADPRTGFRPIDLDELVSRAELLRRVDRKYVLAARDLPAFLGGLPAQTRILDIGGRRAFGYRSVYFDTPGLDSYLASAHRRRRRFKVRIRSYVETGARYAEVKLRGLRSTTVKERVPYHGSEQELGPEAWTHVDEVLVTAGLRPDRLSLAPALTTRYRRTTLFLPATGSRLTVDEDVTWVLPDGTARLLPHHVIVETKSERAGAPVDRLLWSMRHRPCPVSKYATGLAALRPDLPANRWQPLLRRHIAPATEEKKP